MREDVILQVSKFKYLGSIIQNIREINEEAKGMFYRTISGSLSFQFDGNKLECCDVCHCSKQCMIELLL